MADWRQIQARIRKAKSGTDPAEKLAELYQRTRDGMVAFELARFQEKAGENSEAAKWYTEAAQHFRRAQWRVKAEEALTRLGAPIPAPLSAKAISAAGGELATSGETSEPMPRTHPENSGELYPNAAADRMDTQQNPHAEENAEEDEATEGMPESSSAGSLAPPAGAPAGDLPAGKRRRRRGRRGGRGRRRSGAATVGTTPPPERAPSTTTPVRRPQPVSPAPRSIESAEPEPMPVPEYTREPAYAAAASAHPASPAGPSWQGVRGRAGEPALASRIAQLESQLRRLLACPLACLDDADQAPAGPGVLLLSDSDQVTHYYIEACQTLRIGIGNLLRGGRGGKSSGQLKQLMAENLGIAESRVSKYLKDHCSVRWLQLDEGAGELAHFAMAVLRPVVNE